MHAQEVFREAWRNIQSGAAKAAWLSVALILLVTLLSVAELSTVAALDQRARNYHDAGGSVRVLKVEAGIDPQRCDALPATSGIHSAGALRTVAPIGITSLAGITTPTFETTLGFQAILGLDATLDPGVLISEPLAKRWQIRAGDTLATDQGPMPVAAVFPYPEDDGRDSRLANAILFPSLEKGTFDECWADVWPSTAAFDSLIRASQGTGSGQAAASVTTLNPRLGQVFTGADEYLDRITRFAPAAAGAIGVAIGLLGGTRRRLEYASSLHAGVSARHLTLISLVEATVWGGISALVATAIATLIARFGTPLIANALYGHLLVTSGAAVLGAVTGSLLVAASSRETRLFKYFKERS
jgi:hypothetical protein